MQRMSSRAVVWFKKDLRCRDHAPLAAAAACDEAVGLYVIEPEWLQSAECAAQHVAFALGCLAELRRKLAARGLPLLVRVGPVPQVLDALRREMALTHLFSHEETGPGWSYTRDKAVAAWCRSNAVAWQEWPHTGVVRRLRSRAGWAARWQRRMDAPEIVAPTGFAAPRGVEPTDLPSLAAVGAGHNDVSLPPFGEAAAWSVLRSFLDERALGYRSGLSSPLSAETACSRLSAHLAFGTVSMRCVHQATEARVAQLRAQGQAGFAHALRAFAGRLRWHCHFMQKLEDEPQIEFRNFARVCDGLREGSFDTAKFEAWCEGRTGFAMVDACMRSLKATGWLNFRMRAMLVSFASYHLWLHWRETGVFLARQFVDFEPGIHWSQMQMQSGTTGINTLRIYSPTKQAHDQDAQGTFIRRWVPELARVPLPHLAEPWRMSSAQQHASGCVIGRDYPAPVVDAPAAVKHAKDVLYALRKDTGARHEADAIQSRHGSRKSGLPATRRPARAAAPRAQRDLFARDDGT
jgi:deoxyribodipyrimidine photo-lyase